MAAKSKKNTPKSKAEASEPKARVTRITAKSIPKKGKKAARTEAVEAKKVKATKTKKKSVFSAMAGYFKGAWIELKQVRWPTRRATWELTLAVIVFTAFFVALIVLLDLGFQKVFELIIK